MEQSKKDHHYVPRYYLNGFTSHQEPEYIYRYEKGSHKIIKTSTKQVGFERHLYSIMHKDGSKDTNTTEDFLHDEIESPSRVIIDKIRANQMIDESEKEIFSRYLVYLLKRVPYEKRKFKEEVGPKILPEFTEQINKEMEQIIAANPEQVERYQLQQAEINRILEQYKIEIPDNAWVEALHHNSQIVVDVIKSMTWQFLVGNEENPFLTSDNPVFIDETIGIAKEFSEISVPISRTIALWLSWRANRREGFIRTTMPAIKEINRRTVFRAHRYVFAPIQASWIKTLVNKTSLRLTRFM